MHFSQDADRLLHHELMNESVYTNTDFNRFSLPHEGLLLDALRNNAANLSDERWLLWLIRRHGCARLENLRVDKFFLKAVKFGGSDRILTDLHDNYPVAIFGNQLMLACARPIVDQPKVQEFAKRAGSKRITCLAITPKETADLRIQMSEFSN